MVMEMDSYFNVGNRVRDLRAEHGLSQEQLALMADITPSYLGQVERNIKNPTIRTIEKISLSMGVSLAEFFSTSPATPDLDPISKQVVSQIYNRSDEQKLHILGMVKEITRYLDHS